jgi:HSP20 family molecular chaperone IbpA
MSYVISSIILLIAIILFVLTIRQNHKKIGFGNNHNIFDGINVQELEDAYILSTDFIGFPKASVKTKVENGYIHITGSVSEIESDGFANIESFDKSCPIPINANLDQMKIKMKADSIIITIPKQSRS